MCEFVLLLFLDEVADKALARRMSQGFGCMYFGPCHISFDNKKHLCLSRCETPSNLYMERNEVLVIFDCRPCYCYTEFQGYFISKTVRVYLRLNGKYSNNIHFFYNIMLEKNRHTFFVYFHVN